MCKRLCFGEFLGCSGYPECDGIKKRVYPHLLRHSIATILLDTELVPIDRLQKFLSHLDLSTIQIDAEISLRALNDNYTRALGGMGSSYFAEIWAFAIKA